MSHYAKIPALLDALVVSPSIAEAPHRCQMTGDTVYNYLLRSRAGDQQFQKIEWFGIVAPFHVHFANTKVLAAQAIEQAALDRALNGCWVPSYYQGAPVWEELDTDITDPDILFLMYGQRDRLKRDEHGNRVQVKQWLKPSEQLAIKMLESWHKRYRPHQQVDVNYGGVLRLERADERTAPQVKVIEHFAEEDNETEQRGGRLALGRPAQSSEEMDKWNQSGEFKPQPVAFVDAEGNRTERVAASDPVLSQSGDSEFCPRHERESAPRRRPRCRVEESDADTAGESATAIDCR